MDLSFTARYRLQPVVVDKLGGQASGLPIFSCRAGFHTPLMNFLGVTQLDVGAAAKPPARAVLTPYKGCFRADYRPPLHKMTSTA